MTETKPQADSNSGEQSVSDVPRGAISGFLLVVAIVMMLFLGLIIYNRLLPVGYMKLREFNENQAKWESQNITHYRMSVYPDYYGSVPMPLIVEVIGNEVISVTDANGEKIPPTDDAVSSYNYQYLFTIPGLFSYISQYYSEPPSDIKVSYNVDLGYPENIYIDPYKEPCCQDFIIAIQNFEVLP